MSAVIISVHLSWTIIKGIIFPNLLFDSSRKSKSVKQIEINSKFYETNFITKLKSYFIFIKVLIGGF